jgi:hypothetical protein
VVPLLSLSLRGAALGIKRRCSLKANTSLKYPNRLKWLSSFCCV